LLQLTTIKFMAEFKFFCPQCVQQILCDTGYSGTQINCPACKQVVVVPQAPGSAAQPPVPAKSRVLRNVLVIAAAVIVLAGLVTVGWFGYSKYKREHLPAVLVGMWSGEEGGNDSVGGNKATLTDITFAEGKAGRAFVFNGETSLITVPASKSLTVSNLTLAAWIFPADSQPRPIIEYGGGGQAMSIGLWINTSGGTSLVPGAIYAAIRDRGSMNHFIEVKADGGTIALKQWNHLAFTYDTTTRAGILYCNGVQVGSTVSSIALVPRSFCQVNLGYRDVNSLDILRGYRFSGLLNEIAIYNGALSAEEIKAIAVK
jgi:hypothetical protein